jgi:hypothetical protein
MNCQELFFCILVKINFLKNFFLFNFMIFAYIVTSKFSINNIWYQPFLRGFWKNFLAILVLKNEFLSVKIYYNNVTA